MDFYEIMATHSHPLLDPIIKLSKNLNPEEFAQEIIINFPQR